MPSGSVALASRLMTAPSASVRSVKSVLKTGGWLSVGHRPGEGVGVGQAAVGDGDDGVVAARAGGVERAADDAGARC